MVSFTGSPNVGWKLKQQSGKKKVTLELGGNAACIIDHDADIQDATARLIIGRVLSIRPELYRGPTNHRTSRYLSPTQSEPRGSNNKADLR